MKKVLLITLVACILCLTACGGGGSTKNNIVGLWKSSDGSDLFYNTIEFFSDGTQMTEAASWSGTYTVEGNRLRISGKLYGEVFSYQITNNGNTLILTSESGYSKTYTRAN
ncbi:MAG: hypothetical protein IKW04_04465 [Clostridia bacterium]|nr:hypothetical protein [Clostridia bacterium]